MEDENLTTSTPVEGDVVQTSTPSQGMTPAPEPSTPPMEATTETTPQTTGAPEYERVAPKPQTEQTLAEDAVHDARANAYLNKGHGISDWIKNTYNYDQQQAGTMWVAGKINDVATQMSFLEATLNEDMYSELDLQKYFFDTNLATARAYAKEKKHETAYGYYRAASEKALAEGGLTGWYMPAEANYLLSQWAVAGEKLKEPNLSIEDKNRANSVRASVESWFNSNNITWRGIECLNHMYYQETVRHNKELERLQDQANQIAAAQNQANRAAAAASNALQLRTLEFQIAEQELDMGWDLDRNGIIGHSNTDMTGQYTGDADRFGWYPDKKTWAQHNLDAGFKFWGTDEMKLILGKDYEKSYSLYRGQIDKKRYQEIYNTNGTNIMTKESMNKWGNNKLKSGEEIPALNPITGERTQVKINNNNNQLFVQYQEDGSVRLYVFDDAGIAYQLDVMKTRLSSNWGTDITLSDENRTTLQARLAEQSLTLNTDTTPVTIKDEDGKDIDVQIGYKPYTDYDVSADKIDGSRYWSNTSLGKSNAAYDTLQTAEKQGYKRVRGTMDTSGVDSSIVVVSPEGKYYTIENYSGEMKSIKDGSTVSMTIDKDSGKATFTHASGGKIGNTWMKNHTIDYAVNCLENSVKVGYDSDGNIIYMYTNPDGTNVYLRGEKTITGRQSIGGSEDRKTFDVVPDTEVKKAIGKEAFESYNNDAYNYVHGIKPKNSYSISSEDMINEIQGSVTQEQKDKFNAEVQNHYPSSDSATPKKITEEQKSSSKTKTETQTDKTSEEQVLEDASKNEVELGNKAKEEIEKNQERYNKLFNIT